MADCSGEEQNQGVSCGAPYQSLYQSCGAQSPYQSCGAPFQSLPRLKPHGSLPSELPPPEGGHTVAIKIRSQVIT